MDIDEYEFEEELTHSKLTELLEKMADDIRRGELLELPMPSLREGQIELPLGEPIETGLEVKIRKSTVRVNLALRWNRVETVEE
ncbi:MAG: hypothetical protein ACFFD9_05410 [Candidatus Thorarchaeota archaeon]